LKLHALHESKANSAGDRLNGSLRFSGVGLTPVGKEKLARVTKILASAPVPNLGLAPDATAMLQPLHDLADQFLPVK
jgi:hypothetical protein